MKAACNVATLIERFFTERLMRQRNVSGNTIASYRDTFRLLFMFAHVQLRKSPSVLTLADLDATFIGAFRTDLEVTRGASAKTRNLRLTAIRSFFRFVSFEEPAHRALIQRVLATTEQASRQATGALPDAPRDRGGSRRARSNDVAWPLRSHFAAGRGPDGLTPLRADWP
ncbi:MULTISPECIES: site-specific integrase [unclassified Bradyrhizobium]